MGWLRYMLFAPVKFSRPTETIRLEWQYYRMQSHLFYFFQNSKLPKRSKREEDAATSKAAPAKKPKAKKAAEKGDGKGASDSTGAKAGKASRSKASKAGGDAPASKVPGGTKRGKKTAE